jgi:hypothetical protein
MEISFTHKNAGRAQELKVTDTGHPETMRRCGDPDCKMCQRRGLEGHAAEQRTE